MRALILALTLILLALLGRFVAARGAEPPRTGESFAPG